LTATLRKFLVAFQMMRYPVIFCTGLDSLSHGCHSPPMIYRLLRPALFRLDPERAHRASIAALRAAPRGAPASTDPVLASTVAGLAFPNPVGLAAGYDKDAEVPDALLGLGFGCVEVGSITPRPQSGNPRPRLFRLVEDRAVINRMGFNNAGAEAVRARLAASRAAGAQGSSPPSASPVPGVLGVNIGANKESPDRIADYAQMARTMAPYADYLAVNVSSPNTPGLRALQDEGALAGLLDAVLAARDHACAQASTKRPPPVFLKVAPDLAPADIDAIARLALDRQLGALIVANTTVERPSLRSCHGSEAGGLSGAPLKPLALARLRDFRSATGSAIPLIGVGGIFSAMDAWERIRAGASLVQVYTGMVYRGPGIASTIADGLAYLVRREGFASIAQAVGSE
jgi:dihydroorotate dehydrogenase